MYLKTYLIKSFFVWLITQLKPRKIIFRGCYFAKKLILWLPDRDTLIQQSPILIMTNGDRPPAPDLEKVRMGNYSLIWSGLIAYG